MTKEQYLKKRKLDFEYEVDYFIKIMNYHKRSTTVESFKNGVFDMSEEDVLDLKSHFLKMQLKIRDVWEK